MKLACETINTYYHKTYLRTVEHNHLCCIEKTELLLNDTCAFIKHQKE